MDFVDFTAGSDDNDRRLDKVIRIFASNLPLTEIYKAIRKGLIKVNDKKSSQSDHVKKGDKIIITGANTMGTVGGTNTIRVETID